MDIANWLKAARLHANLTQEKAGALVNVGKGNWSAWEKGRHKPSIDQVARIAQITKYPLPPGLNENLSFIEVPARIVTNDATSISFVESVSDQDAHIRHLSYIQRVPVTVIARLVDGSRYEEIETMGANEGFVNAQIQDPGAYALRMRGDQMAPAVRDGWYLVASPATPLAVGEYVVVKLRDGTQMIRELLFQRPDAVAVMDVNGGSRETIPMENVEYVHQVTNIMGPSQRKHI